MLGNTEEGTLLRWGPKTRVMEGFPEVVLKSSSESQTEATEAERRPNKALVCAMAWS